MDVQSVTTIIAIVSAIGGAIVVFAVPVWRINTAKQTIALLEQQNDALRQERTDENRRMLAELDTAKQRIAILEGRVSMLSDDFGDGIANRVISAIHDDPSRRQFAESVGHALSEEGWTRPRRRKVAGDE